MNKVFIFGNLGQDPDVRDVGDSVVANLRVATNKRYKDSDGELQNKTTWHNVAVWGRQAEIVEEYLKKGDPVLLECEIINRQYEKDGVDVYTNDLRCLPYGLFLVGSKGFTQSDDDEEDTRSSRRKNKSNRSNSRSETSRSRSRSRRRDEDEDLEETNTSSRSTKRKGRSRKRPAFSE